VRSDLVLVDAVVGAGEVAVSDHRSSQPTFDELARLAAECRVGGMLGGKAGILHLHMGTGERGLELVQRIVRETEIPASQIIPTHCNRSEGLLEEALGYAAMGGRIDLTAGLGREGEGIRVEEAVRRAVAQGVPLDRISVSSDANGSLPVFDEAGALVGLGIGTQGALLDTLRALVHGGVVELADACTLYTLNPARFYGLDGKGRIAPGADADLIVLDDALELTDVFARGRRAVAAGEVLLRGSIVTDERLRAP
jgi:beta-aspartyl-dipeptidase (metallo-type)